MSNRFYKARKNRLVAGVVAGLADKFGCDLALARILAIILMVSTQFGIFLWDQNLLLLNVHPHEVVEHEQSGGLS